MGRSVIQQAISALEDWRSKNHHLYKDIPDTQVRLRTTTASGPLSQLQSTMSQSGSTLRRCSRPLALHLVSGAWTLPPCHSCLKLHSLPDAYTVEELTRCSWWGMTEFSGPHHLRIGLRDHAMMLLGATTALRGEGLRMLQLSDLFMSTAFLDATQTGKEVPVSVGTLPMFTA